ncbi:MAG TPA: hypothetical protein VNK82_11065 [Terriglobales bacterium]|nr:hypothetical protein [Terriglobales bacterium]
MTEFERQVLADLAVLKEQMRSLVGNGQPGRLRCLEERVERHEALAQRAGGVGALLATLLTLFHAGIDYLRLKH